MRFTPASAALLASAVLLSACADSDVEARAARPALRAFSAFESGHDVPAPRVPVEFEGGHDVPAPHVPVEPDGPVASDEPEAAVACGRLEVSEGLERGEQLASCDERVRLFLQPDGNLILDVQDLGVIWESGTSDSGAERLRMLPSGVLALVDAASSVLWQSHTFGLAGSYASLHDDGDLVIFDPAGRPIWHALAARGPRSATDDR